MSKEVQLFGDTLPSVPASYKNSLRALGAARSAGSGLPFLKMDKGGHWSYGPDEIVVKSDEKWAVNPNSFKSGVIGWLNGEVVGEEMYLIGDQQVDRDLLKPIHSNKPDDGWKDQLSFDLVSLDKGERVTYKATSRGGINAVSRLAQVIVSKDSDEVIPVVICSTDSYVHKSYGKIYTPEFAIVDWMAVKNPRGKPKPELV
jgi:hypothetical protein